MTGCKISLVTVLFNSDNVLEGFFRSLSIQDFEDYHLYVIDNTSNVTTDRLIVELTIKYNISSWSHIKNPDNVGVAKANNQGIKLSLLSGSKYTLILNNDIEFLLTDVLSSIYENAILKNESLITPKILFYDTEKIWMAGGEFSYIRGSTKHVGEGSANSAKFDIPRYFDYAPTCFMLIDNKVFREVGLMDERYFVYYDDSDFIYRTLQAGYKVFYNPKITILHKVSSSTGGKESLFTLYYSNRNRIRFIKKNFTGIRYLTAISFTLFTRIFKFFKYNQSQRKELIRALQDGWTV